MLTRESRRPWLVTAALGLVTGGIATSEYQHQNECMERPVESRHHMAYEIVECQDPALADRPPTLVFLHGWPDDVTLFRPFAKALSTRYRCVNCNLPGYPLPSEYSGVQESMPTRTWGFTLEEAAFALKNTIEKTCGNAKSVTLVTHDWGAIIGYLLHMKHPEDSLINRMVSMDVGWRIDGFPIAGMLGVLAYQSFLNIFFLLPSAIGSPLTAAEQLLLGRVAAQGSATPTSAMNWPYRSAWRDMVSNGPSSRLNEYRPAKIPLLFLHGDALPRFQRFYDAEWVNRVEQTRPGVSKVVELPGGHWFVNSSYSKTLEVVDKWLADTEPVTTQSKI